MNIIDVNAKLEAGESLTPDELIALKETINDKDENPYRRIQDALQLLDVSATGTREEMIPRLLENLPVQEEETPATGEDSLIPAADGPEGESGTPGVDGEDVTPEGTIGDPGPEGEEGEDGNPAPDPDSVAPGGEAPPTPPPAATGPEGADGPSSPAGTPDTPTIGAEDMADAQRAANQAAEDEREESTTKPEEVRPPEETEEERAAKAKAMEEAEEKARLEKEEREAQEKKDAEEAAAEARKKEEADAAEAEESEKAQRKAAKKKAKAEKKKFFEEALERHGIDEDYLPRIKKYIGRGQTVAQLKDGSRRLFDKLPENGGRREAETVLGYDLDFVWNDYVKA